MIDMLVAVGEGNKSPGSYHLIGPAAAAPLGVRVTVGQRVSVGLGRRLPGAAKVAVAVVVLVAVGEGLGEGLDVQVGEGGGVLAG